MSRSTASALATVLVLAPASALACSVFSVRSDQGVHVGRNLDWYPDSTAQVWYEPPGEGTHGVVFVSVGGDHFAQDAMNDQGPVVAGATIPEIDLEEQPELPNATWHLIMDVLRTSSTVDEALATIDGYDLSAYPSVFAYGHLLFADATGASAVMEGDTFIRGEGDHQVMTNFALSAPELGYWPCPRYDLIEEGLSTGEPLDHDDLAGLVEAARGSAWGGFTVYSQLFDLDDLTVTLWWESDFDRPLVFDLAASEAWGELEVEGLWAEAVEAGEQDVPFDTSPPQDTAGEEEPGGCSHATLPRAGALLALAALLARRSRRR